MAIFILMLAGGHHAWVVHQGHCCLGQSKNLNFNRCVLNITLTRWKDFIVNNRLHDTCSCEGTGTSCVCVAEGSECLQ